MSWRYSRAGQRQTLRSSRLRRGTDTFKYRYLEKGGGWGAKKSSFNVTQNSSKKAKKKISINVLQCRTAKHIFHINLSPSLSLFLSLSAAVYFLI